MDLYQIPTDVLLFDLVMYGCLPLWLIMGSIDYWCHRKSKIETTQRNEPYHKILRQWEFLVFLVNQKSLTYLRTLTRFHWSARFALLNYLYSTDFALNICTRM